VLVASHREEGVPAVHQLAVNERVRVVDRLHVSQKKNEAQNVSGCVKSWTMDTKLRKTF
jgi:hypothetical protein